MRENFFLDLKRKKAFISNILKRNVAFSCVCRLEWRVRMPHDDEFVGSNPAVANIMGIVILIGSVSACQGNELN